MSDLARVHDEVLGVEYSACVGAIGGWFFEHFEHPSHCLPIHNGRYLWVYPHHDVRDVLREQGPDISNDLLQKAMEHVGEYGGADWVCRAEQLPVYVPLDVPCASFQVHVLAETELAFLVRVDGLRTKDWVPRSQLKSGTTV